MNTTMMRSLFFVFIFCSLCVTPNFAAVISNGIATNVSSHSAMIQQFKNQKRMAHLENYLQKRSFSTSDPIGRWLVYGVVGLAVAILLGLFNLGALSALAGLFGVVCLVIWFIKQNG